MTADESPAERRRRALLEDAEAGDVETEDGRVPDVPVDAVAEVERLTRLARNAADRADATGAMGERLDGPDEPTFYLEKRDALLAAHGYTSRLRESDDTLVLYPEEWVEDGTVQFDRIDDTDRAVECSLSGPGNEDDWADVEAHNAALVASVEEEHGPEHAANARAFADFMGNHYAKEAERATGAEVREFLRDYFPRNAWPSEAETSLVEVSVRKMFEAAGVEPPAF
jgi:hypothetical protein